MERPKIADPKLRRAYKVRDRTLAALGFRSYREYLASSLWRGLARSHRFANPDCILCGSPVEEVHHKSYDRATLAGEKPDGLVSLCSAHHREVEFAGWGRKRTPRQVSIALRKLIAARRD